MTLLALKSGDRRHFREGGWSHIAIAAFGYLAEDGAVTGRDLLGDKTQPSGEVAALRERITTPDRSYDCAGDFLLKEPRIRSPSSVMQCLRLASFRQRAPHAGLAQDRAKQSNIAKAFAFETAKPGLKAAPDFWAARGWLGPTG